MDTDRSDRSGYKVATLLGAAAGGLFVVCVTRAIPKMMNRLRAGTMENMRTPMGSAGGKPEDM